MNKATNSLMTTVVFPTAWDDQGTRKSGFADVFLSYMANEGYVMGNSLKVPGAYAFEFSKDGKIHKIGMKSAYDRTLNTAFEMGKKVDEVYIMTFRWNVDEQPADWRPTHLQIYKISKDDLAAKFAKVEAAKVKNKTPTAFAFIPMDQAKMAETHKPFNKVAGTVDDTAELVFEAPLVFSDRGAGRVESAPVAVEPAAVANEPSQGIGELVFQHKEALAKLYGTSVDKVRIIVEA